MVKPERDSRKGILYKHTMYVTVQAKSHSLDADFLRKAVITHHCTHDPNESINNL